MHLSIRHAQALEQGDAPQNPAQTPADMLALSFTDSDLACMARAHADLAGVLPSLRLTSLAALKHPLSVDMYLEQVAARAKVILVRLLGGYDWWRYGADELAKLARKEHIALAMIPGDGRPDSRLLERSTVSPDMLHALNECMAHGGAENAGRVLIAMSHGLRENVPDTVSIPSGMLYRRINPKPDVAASKPSLALLVFYRAHYLAADTAPVDALLAALAAQGFAARAFMVASLKDPHALAALQADAHAHPPNIVLDLTSFSAGTSDAAHPLAHTGAPILQCAMAASSREAWLESSRGLAPADLAMHVVLPEADGRVFTRAISFKAQEKIDQALEFTQLIHSPEPDRIAYVAALAGAWARLAVMPAAKRRLALVLSDYPGRAGRCAYAVGLDAPASAQHILRLLAENGYSVQDAPPDSASLMQALRTHRHVYPLDAYLRRLHALPAKARQDLAAAWGAPEDDAQCQNGAFEIAALCLGKCVVALQPDRGSKLDRKAGYHDPATPPRHGYLAFYWWLGEIAGIDAMIHLGTHGNLEWLPGKPVALTPACWPEIALGPVPVAYPYIVSDPGEAAQAKRRIAAVTLSHMTPPLANVELTPELCDLEGLVDEFGSADGLDGRRMRLLKADILHRARRAGLASAANGNDDALMEALETHLCDIKEQRVRDGLHVFGAGAHGKNEAAQLLAAMAGAFVPPGPGGSPARGRMDVLPTGRNIISVDPRTIPTRTASVIGKRAAEEFVRRYTQDHGDYPRTVMLDLWGSATLRNGGDEIAQALWLMGVEPVWNNATGRATGFTLAPHEPPSWPRIDVSLRISGLFRDMFAHLIALFDDAARAVAGLEGRTPQWRIFGNAPGDYGTGVSERLDRGHWRTRAELGQSYLDASAFAYGRGAEALPAAQALAQRIKAADALVHVQDQRETDVLDGAGFADAEGGFAAAAHALGNTPALYHLDSSNPKRLKVRTLAEEISLTLQARALSPRWLQGQMRHGHAGASALADVVDQMFAFAATAEAVSSAQFDAAFEAYLVDDTIRAFVALENPQAFTAMAARFEEAARRGFWQPLRNSALPMIEEWLGAAKEIAA